MRFQQPCDSRIFNGAKLFDVVGYPAVRGSKYPRNKGRAAGSGSTMDTAPAKAGAGNHVWSYDFVEAQTHDGRKLRVMTLIDE